MNDILTPVELKSLVLEAGVVTEDQLRLAEERMQSEGGTLSDAILWHNFITDEELGRLIADHFGLPFVVVSQQTITEDVLRIVPELVAKRRGLIAYALDADGLHIAVSDPLDVESPNFVQRKTGLPVIVHYATARDIQNALSFYRKQVVQAFDELLATDIERADREESREMDAPIIRIVDTLVEYAYQNRASDIHLEPREQTMLVRFRIDGVLHDIVKLPPTLHPQVVARIKILAKLPTDEHQTPQDGKIEFALENDHLDVRVSLVPTTEGEKVVLRLLSDRARQFALANLGFSEKNLAHIRAAYEKPYGMVLVTGPTGCGKTTTLYSILKLLNNRRVNIVTIEDPVEYDVEGVNQIQVNPEVDLTFATGLRSILRQDPNIILVGEIRDNETAGIAINLAMTGHLVLSTLHTNDAATAIPRLIDMHIEPFLIASTINAIVAERLVRQIHPACRISEEVDGAQVMQRIGEALFEKVFGPMTEGKKVRLYRGKGCPACHDTGFEGRIGIFEVLTFDDTLRDAIIKEQNAQDIEALAVAQGMAPMLENGLIKVHQGTTTLDEVLQATKE